ncbi:MAG: hypothetical protein KA419_09085 [Acidobacteria bacterium]|nr:hypothetical protein [Acidobacteriota bacterium]
MEVTAGWRCAWCSREGGDLVLLPHPLSLKNPEFYRFRVEAEIVGQVVAIWNDLSPRN